MLVSRFGINNWNVVASYFPNRNVRQCRERWFKYLSPEIKNDEWTIEEDQLLCRKREELGPKWKEISAFFPGRTDINIKSRYNVIKRRIMRMKMFMSSNSKNLITSTNDETSISHEIENSKSLDADILDDFQPCVDYLENNLYCWNDFL